MINNEQIEPTVSGPVPAKSNKLIPVIFVLVLLCLAGGAAAYSYYTRASVTLPGLLDGYTDRTESIASMKIDMKVDVDFSEIESTTEELEFLPFLSPNDKNMSFAFVASYDASNKDDLKFSSVVSATLGSLALEAEMIVLTDTMYAKLSKMPDLSFLPISLALEPYENKWFSFPNDKSKVDTSILTDKFTPEEKKHIEKIFREGNTINNILRLPVETIGGEPSYHFSFDFDKEAFIASMESYKNYVDSIGKGDPEISDFHLEDLRESLDQVKDFKGEIWVARSDKLVRKLSLNFGVQPDIVKDEQVKVKIVAIVSDYNQPVSIVAPAESISFEKFISDMMFNSF